VLTASTLIALCPAHAKEVESAIFDDPVNYSGWNTGPLPMEAIWKSKSGSRPSIVTIAPDNTGFELNNGVIFTRLPRNAGTDFELSFDALHTSFSRLIWAGLFNDEGTQGYVLAWDSGLSKYFNSQGVVSIRKFDIEPGSPGLRFNTGGALLSKPQASGHNPGNDTTAAIAEPYARLKLTWQGSTHTLRLYVDGALMQTVVDSSFNSFRSLYLAGGTGSRFDNILVASPLASPTSGNAR
jgi:hypothetical protein